MSTLDLDAIEVRLAAARVRWAAFPPAFLESQVQADLAALVAEVRRLREEARRELPCGHPWTWGDADDATDCALCRERTRNDDAIHAARLDGARVMQEAARVECIAVLAAWESGIPPAEACGDDDREDRLAAEAGVNASTQCADSIHALDARCTAAAAVAAAVAADADAAERARVRRECGDIVRDRFPAPPELP